MTDALVRKHVGNVDEGCPAFDAANFNKHINALDCLGFAATFSHFAVCANGINYLIFYVRFRFRLSIPRIEGVKGRLDFTENAGNFKEFFSDFSAVAVDGESGKMPFLIKYKLVFHFPNKRV